MSPVRLKVLPDLEQISATAAHEFVRLARAAIARSGRFTVALAGGSTPRRMYELLAQEPLRAAVDWSRVEFFWGDERAVGTSDPQSNYRMAREALLDKIPVTERQVHRLCGESADLEAAARCYAGELARVLGAVPGGEPPRCDLLLLGLGDDGHTLSLFPETAAVHETKAWVVANDVPRLKTRRLTFTAALANASRNALFLVGGEDKAVAVQAILEGPHDPEHFPAQLIQLAQGNLTWLLNRAAGSRLSLDTLQRAEDVGQREIHLAPSILAADFTRLGEEVRQVEAAGANRIHVDVMDGHFVPNISMGPFVVEALRPVTKLPLEVHLMIEAPERYLEAFAAAGSDSLLVHAEGACNLHRTLQQIRQLGKKVGVVINPATPAAVLDEVLEEVDIVLLMTVNPGFGGQKFLASVLPKIRRLREQIDERNPACELEVDGGIDATTTSAVVAAGANVLVAGSAIFRASEGVAGAMDRIRSAARVFDSPRET